MSSSQPRLLVEFGWPVAAAVGGFAAFGAGGLATIAGQPLSWAVITGVALGLPLALFCLGYSTLLATGRVPAGVYTPVAIYWMIGFPLSMLVHSIVTEWLFTGRPGLPAEPLWQFLLYHALLSMGFGIGFLWANEQIGRRWWPRIREHNVYAYHVVEQYKDSATELQRQKEASAALRRRRREEKAARRSGAAAS